MELHNLRRQLTAKLEGDDLESYHDMLNKLIEGCGTDIPYEGIMVQLLGNSWTIDNYTNLIPSEVETEINKIIDEFCGQLQDYIKGVKNEL